MTAQVIKIGSKPALVKQIKAYVQRADQAAADADHLRHKAGKLLIALHEQCEHGEWLPFLKTIGISKQRASELMQAGQDVTAPTKERERVRKAVKQSRRRKSAEAKGPLRNGPLDDAIDAQDEENDDVVEDNAEAPTTAMGFVKLEESWKTFRSAWQAASKEARQQFVEEVIYGGDGLKFLKRLYGE